MKLLFALLFTVSNIHAAVGTDTIVLDETGVKNLRIETVEAEETDFEETVFALGRIAEIPERHAVLSSRISGRVIGLDAQEGDSVKAGQVLVRVESRQPGNPPPVIELKSPIDGLLVSSHIRLGEPVEPEKELLDISDLSEVLAIARVPESQASKLAPGSKAHIRVSALGDQPLEGEMLRFGTSADRESGTIDAVFKVANPGLRMRSDMRAEFSIVMSHRSGVVSVPRSALQGDTANRFVYVKHFDIPNAFVKTKVQIGEMNDRFVEITSGLFPADEVVTRGAYSLSFAGASSVSLKEALDAAHGHEHAADGSELTPEKRAAAGGDDHHDHDEPSPVWKYISGVLFVLLLASLITKKRASLNTEPEAL
ncbi:MAG: efflux RND transporter periplasmic adaptor subunit [Luteolibacter sp.]|uniref:efflux RND transporter periplasmic adaptor subunit n=1 Tax=Luteolibacter sp. TaxID=1962973 RepID=UPI0032650FFA